MPSFVLVTGNFNQSIKGHRELSAPVSRAWPVAPLYVSSGWLFGACLASICGGQVFIFQPAVEPPPPLGTEAWGVRGELSRLLWALAPQGRALSARTTCHTHPRRGSTCLAGAAHLGGGADAGRTPAEKPGGAAAAPGAGAGRAGDRHPAAGAPHHHPPAVPGEAPGQETQGQVQEEPTEAQGWKPHQPPFRLVSGDLGEVGADRGAGVAGLLWEPGTELRNVRPQGSSRSWFRKVHSIPWKAWPDGKLPPSRGIL